MLLQIDVSGGMFLGGWEIAALVALLVSFGIIAIAFAIGVGFHYRDLEEWAKRELYEVMISALMLGIFVAFLGILYSISVKIAGGDPFDIAHNCLNEMLFDTAGLFLSLYNTNNWLSAISTLMIGFFIPISFPPIITIRIGSYVSPEAGLSAIVGGLDTIFNLISAMIALLLGEQVLLDFFRVVMLKYFLPLGILMRTFPLTRVAGSTLIAIALGAYIIYPLAIIYTTQMYNSYKAIAVPGRPGDWRGDLVLGPVLGDEISGPMETINSMMRNFVIVSACSLVDIVITLSAIRSLIAALGGDPDLFGLARLI